MPTVIIGVIAELYSFKEFDPTTAINRLPVCGIRYKLLHVVATTVAANTGVGDQTGVNATGTGVLIKASAQTDHINKSNNVKIIFFIGLSALSLFQRVLQQDTTDNQNRILESLRRLSLLL
jgi:hypothetical protein